ncbi:MAG: PepSY-like domain-containing protein [Bacteroidaceae bacterium]|nr:PepSY-like domain-containing protein [Bacteroidaceae bacterium]
MKKFFLAAFALFLTLSNVKADERDRVITKEQLPEVAQSLLATHFSGLKISLVKEDREFVSRNYEVIFADGTKVEFTRKGEWKEVDCRKNEVPAALIPANIKSFVSERYPDAKIVQIDRDKNDYEVKLSNRLELTFDKNFNIIDIDD